MFPLTLLESASNFQFANTLANKKFPHEKKNSNFPIETVIDTSFAAGNTALLLLFNKTFTTGRACGLANISGRPLVLLKQARHFVTTAFIGATVC